MFYHRAIKQGRKNTIEFVYTTALLLLPFITPLREDFTTEQRSKEE